MFKFSQSWFVIPFFKVIYYWVIFHHHRTFNTNYCR